MCAYNSELDTTRFLCSIVLPDIYIRKDVHIKLYTGQTVGINYDISTISHSLFNALHFGGILTVVTVIYVTKLPAVDKIVPFDHTSKCTRE